MFCYKIWVDIIIPIICALIGGGLTLIGVVITIRHSNKMIRNDFINKYKPSFKLRNHMDDFDIEGSKPLMFNGGDYMKKSRKIVGMFSNTDKANFEVDAIFINGESNRINVNRYIAKSENFDFCLCIKKNLDVETLELKVYDEQNNSYRYKLDFFTNSVGNIEINKITNIG